jgi:hypothetical protein
MTCSHGRCREAEPNDFSSAVLLVFTPMPGPAVYIVVAVVASVGAGFAFKEVPLALLPRSPDIDPAFRSLYMTLISNPSSGSGERIIKLSVGAIDVKRHQYLRAGVVETLLPVIAVGITPAVPPNVIAPQRLL